jgi:DHA1 family tetracycline resistance protein-like MFS transporter
VGKRATLFILLAVFIDTVGFGIIIPSLPRLIMTLTGEGLSEAARYGGWLLFWFAALQFLAAPVLGNLSDRFGRRPVLITSLAAFGFDYLIMGFAPTLIWLFVGRALAGVCGATFATASAYAADISTPAQRARAFGLIGAAWGAGFTLGPAIGGVLGDMSGARVPFFVAAGLALANSAYGYFVLPETLTVERRRPFAFRRANPFGALLEMRRFPLVIGLLVALVLYQIAHDANPSTWTYFTMTKFHWNETQVGLSMAFVGVVVVIAQAGLIGPAVARLGERRTIFAGFALYALGFFGFAFATQGWMLYLWIVPFCFGSIASPALKSILSQTVPTNSQGGLQGALGSLQSLTAVGSPLIMTQLFGFFTSPRAPVYFPGASFFAAAVLTLTCIVVCAVALRRAGGSARPA